MVGGGKVQVAGPRDGATSPARRVPLRWLTLFGSHPAAVALRWPVLPYIDGDDTWFPSRCWWSSPAICFPVSCLPCFGGLWGSMVLGRGEIPARRWPALTTATPEGAVTSMEALSWPRLDPLLEHRGKPLVQSTGQGSGETLFPS